MEEVSTPGAEAIKGASCGVVGFSGLSRLELRREERKGTLGLEASSTEQGLS